MPTNKINIDVLQQKLLEANIYDKIVCDNLNEPQGLEHTLDNGDKIFIDKRRYVAYDDVYKEFTDRHEVFLKQAIKKYNKYLDITRRYTNTQYYNITYLREYNDVQDDFGIYAVEINHIPIFFRGKFNKIRLPYNREKIPFLYGKIDNFFNDETIKNIIVDNVKFLARQAIEDYCTSTRAWALELIDEHAF